MPIFRQIEGITSFRVYADTPEFHCRFDRPSDAFATRRRHVYFATILPPQRHRCLRRRCRCRDAFIPAEKPDADACRRCHAAAWPV